jgi:hypothetical protein
MEGIEFADCMRSHGVPNFPDPSAQGEIPGNFNLESPEVQAAQSKCKKFEPRRVMSTTVQQALITGALAFSVCMRAHGVPQFPDAQKTYNGVVIANLDDTSGSFNPHSPAVRDASKACYGYQLRARSAANQLGAGLPRLPPPSLGRGHAVKGG